MNKSMLNSLKFKYDNVCFYCFGNDYFAIFTKTKCPISISFVMISLICLLKLPNKIIKLGSKEAPAFSSGIRLASYIAGKSVNNPQNLNPHIIIL